MSTVSTVREVFKHGVLAEWAALLSSENGDPEGLSQWDKQCVQVTGTFDTATITIQGSNDGTNWATMNDETGSALTFTAAGLKSILERPLFVRPIAGAGAGGVNVAVRILATRSSGR